MRRINILILAALAGWLLSCRLANAQLYAVAHDFTNSPDGQTPGALAISAATLFGTTGNGGNSGYGMIFQLGTNGTGYTPVYSFAGGTNGSLPNDLVLGGTNLYGSTHSGGTNGYGAIYSVGTNGAGFKLLYSFTNTPDGAYPSAALTLGGNTLYGVTPVGGTNFWGTIFKINTDGTGYALLHSFSNSPDGASPQGAITLSGGTLYGTTTAGGTNGNGILFSIGTNGAGYNVLYSFGNSPDGWIPYGRLLVNNNVIYGTTYNGGTNGGGTVFSINTNGLGYTELYSFSAVGVNASGSYPKAGLVQISNLLYGTTSYGGAYNKGVIFQISTNGAGFAVLKNFTNSPDGATPVSSLVPAGSTLWGTASLGGSANAGQLFSLQLPGSYAVPPTITQPPQNLTVTNGNPASFTNVASGTAPLSYQWYFNTNTLVSGGTNAILFFSAVTNSQAGYYSVIVTNIAGSATSSPALLTVVASSSAAPIITQQPQDYAVTNGYSASFTNAASSGTPLFYQWYFNTNTPVVGGTNNILIIPSAATNQAGYYSVIVSNISGSVVSSPAKLTVISTLPLIFSQPQGLTVTNGNPVGFSVTAAGQNPLQYQWYTNTVTTTHVLVGKTNSTLSYAAASNSLAGYYLVVITNSLGKATSNPALLTVIAAPIITLQPQSTTVTNGSPVSFNAAATGAGQLNFQWLFRTNTLIPGATNLTLSYTNAITNLVGTYSMLVTNTFGRATSSVATLTVITKPILLSQNFNPANGSFSLAFANAGKSTNRLWATTNLAIAANWRAIATNIMATNGLWFFTDTNIAQTNSARFYRFSTP